MQTLDIVEALIFRIPELRKVFDALDIISAKRMVSSARHPELENLLGIFERPAVVAVFGLVQMVVLVEPKQQGKVYPAVVIKGDHASLVRWSRSTLCRELTGVLSANGFLPQPFVKKIVYISDWIHSEMHGVVFSHVGGKWIVDDPMVLPVPNGKVTNPREILLEVLDDALMVDGN
jgi:hypothetical protein